MINKNDKNIGIQGRYYKLIIESLRSNEKTINTISEKTDIPLSTVYRLVKRLAELKYVKIRYVIGKNRKRVAVYSLSI